MIDSERQATYDAENLALSGTLLDVVCGATLAMRATRTLTTSSLWWDSICPRPVETRPSRSTATRSSARCSSHRTLISYHPTARWADILHELAHAYAGPHHGHDATFRGRHVELVATLYDGNLSIRLIEQYRLAGLAWASEVERINLHPAGPALKIIQARVFHDEIPDDLRVPAPPPRPPIAL